MAAINVRQLDDNVVRALKLRASLNNRSLESEVRHILECAAEDDMVAKRASFLAMSGSPAAENQGALAYSVGGTDP